MKKEQLVSELREQLGNRIRQSGIKLIGHSAKITDKNNISAAGMVYHAKNILIATGSASSEVFVKNALTCEQLLELESLPKSLKIIGGGSSAIEFAHIFRAFGTEVTVCIRGGRILRNWDQELALSVAQSMKKRGIIIRTNCTREQMEESEAEVTLSAIGRQPRDQGIFADGLDIATDHGIITDLYGRTNIKGIYAAGDVVKGSPMLAHTAMEEARAVVELLAGNKPRKKSALIKCLYISPEAASIGETQEEAGLRGVAAVSAKQTMYANARTCISGTGRGFIKLVADGQTHRLLGAQLMCERAGDIAGELGLAVNAELLIEDLADMAHPHPSFCEEIAQAASTLLRKIT